MNVGRSLFMEFGELVSCHTFREKQNFRKNGGNHYPLLPLHVCISDIPCFVQLTKSGNWARARTFHFYESVDRGPNVFRVWITRSCHCAFDRTVDCVL